jgi:hypothetical protein
LAHEAANKDLVEDTRLRLLTSKKHKTDKPNSGIKGVSWNNGSWVARITVNKQDYYLGRFPDTKEGLKEAVEARRKAEEKYFKPILKKYGIKINGKLLTKRRKNKRLRYQYLKEIMLIGKRYGRLLVLEVSEKRTSDGAIIYKCQCDCGKIAHVRSSALSGGSAKSCGCLHREKVSKGRDGVYPYGKNTFRCIISFEGKSIYFGSFNHKDNALKIANEAKAIIMQHEDDPELCRKLLLELKLNNMKRKNSG